MVSITISTLSDKGASPTEVEDFIKQLLNEINDYPKKTINITISPVAQKKLDSTVVNYIKKREVAYRLKRSEKFDYYALTLHALQKLRYVDESGNIVSQSRFASLFNIRRATLNEHYNSVVKNKKDYKTYYHEIERKLFLEDFNI